MKNLRELEDRRTEAGADLAFFYVSAQNRSCPLLCGQDELHLFAMRSTAWLRAMNAEPERPPEHDALREMVAAWLMKVQIPSAFCPPSDIAERVDLPPEVQPDQIVWLDPGELTSVMRDLQSADLDQLRAFVSGLAATRPSEVEVNRALAEQRRVVKRAERRADYTAQGVGLVIELLFEHQLSIGAAVLGKAAERLASPIAEQAFVGRHRWLTMTEEIEAKLVERQRTTRHTREVDGTKSASLEDFVADRQLMWVQFIRSVMATVAAVIVVLALMAFFLL